MYYPTLCLSLPRASDRRLNRLDTAFVRYQSALKCSRVNILFIRKDVEALQNETNVYGKDIEALQNGYTVY